MSEANDWQTTGCPDPGIDVFAYYKADGGCLRVCYLGNTDPEYWFVSDGAPAPKPDAWRDIGDDDYPAEPKA